MTTPTMTTLRTLLAHVLIDSFFAAALLGRTAERELFERGLTLEARTLTAASEGR